MVHPVFFPFIGATAIFDRIEDVVVQADEINSNLLQFEGGLSVSSTIITGAYALAKKIGKAPPISKPQAVKFANYFLTRRNVQNVEEAWYFLNAMNTLTSNDFHVPVGMISHKKSLITISGHKHKIKNFNSIKF